MSFRRRLLTVATAAAAFAASGVLTVPAAVAGGSGIPLLRYVRTVDLDEVQSAAAELAADYEEEALADNPPARTSVGNGASAPSGSVDLETRAGEVERNRPGGGLSGRSTAITKGLETASPLGVAAGDPASAWKGLGLFDTRFASAGRSYQTEPSDLAMCAGNGYVLEAVNIAVQVYDADGDPQLDGGYANPGRRSTGTHPLLPALGYEGKAALGLNEFFGYRPAYDRRLYADILYGDEPPTGVYGEDLGDPVCKYDADADRWILATYLFHVDADSDYTGETSIAVAVSASGDPTGDWRIFEIDTTNNGEYGGPDHGCGGGSCFGDYPQIGLDDNGLYITTVEFGFFGSAFNGAQLYAINKYDLYGAEDAEDPVRISYLENLTSEAVGGFVGSTYSVQPVDGAPSERVPDTMFFGMLHTVYASSASAISVFRLDNTDKLAGVGCESEDMNCLGASDLVETTVDVGLTYADPSKSLQKPGSTPFLTSYNLRIWGNYPVMKGSVPLDAGTGGKIYGAWMHDGTLLFSTGTAATGSGAASFNPSSGEWKPIDQQIAVAVFAVPYDADGAVGDAASDAAIVGVPGQNLSYPSIAVDADGEGIVGATLVGPGYYPSVAYIPLSVDADGELTVASSLGVALAGVGPNDGFAGVLPPGRRPRWGDYGAIAFDGTSIWMAAGYVAQTCGFAEYLQGNLIGTNGHVAGTCGNTRATLANWSTGIVRYQP